MNPTTPGHEFPRATHEVPPDNMPKHVRVRVRVRVRLRLRLRLRLRVRVS